MTLVVFLAYAAGGGLGYAASRINRLASVWGYFIRAQLILASAVISLLAAWRLQGLADLLWPVLVTGASVIVVGVAYLVTPASPERPGRAVLRGWAANSNGGFWVIPVATAVAGPAGSVIAVLIDRAIVLVFGYFTWVLRRYAPIKQRVRTSWIDQAPLIALIIGLTLNYFSDAPAWTATALTWLAPVMAATGAAMYVGSVLHPSQRLPWRPGMRVWALLNAVRIALLIPLAFLAPTAPIAVALILCAFTVPAFFPPQLSILYGYSDSVVAAASRWTWLFAPIGLVAAEIVIRL